MTPADLTGYTATVQPADVFDLSGLLVTIPSLSTVAGRLAAEALSGARGAADRAAIDEAVAASLQSLGTPPASITDYGSTSFVVVDSLGGAVACAMTMNGAFGARASATGTGILMAANPASSPAGSGNAFLQPMLAGERGGRALVLAASAAGDASTLASLIDAVLSFKQGPQQSAAQVLGKVSQAGGGGVNLFSCRARTNGACDVATDPKRHGLAEFVPLR